MEVHCLRSSERIGSNSLLCSHPKIPDDENDDDGDDDDDDEEDDDDDDDDDDDEDDDDDDDDDDQDKNCNDDDHHPCLGLPHLLGSLPPAYLWHRPSSHHLVLTIKTT